ncbi:MAG TPA: single-stranded DNA-binding protein [Candidatus Omnitrophota bacterium]|nr:single-stranded DNA-binding protein [Candidatus Omnitrophota bacterium]HPS20666.1 single-stranded DNA-binding protein [Candidatus Omnitrophota bacterium]
MAASLNKVFIMGNLTRDPELRYVPSGAAVANFSVAVNRVYKDKTGEKKEETTFVRIVVWGKMAEVCGEYLSKGRAVLVEGRLQSRSWEAQDGQKRNTLEVIADNVQFIGAKEKKEAAMEYGAPEKIDSIDLDAGGRGEQGPAGNSESEEIPF